MFLNAAPFAISLMFLPHGYPWMVLLALLPPLTFKIMQPRLAAWRAQFYPEEVAG